MEENVKTEWEYKDYRTVDEVADSINYGKKFTPSSGIRADDVNQIIQTSLWAAYAVNHKTLNEFALNLRINDKGELIANYEKLNKESL